MRTQCPRCKLIVELTDWQRGRLAQCPDCGKAFEVRPYVQKSDTDEDQSKQGFRLSTEVALIILGIWAVVAVGGVLLYRMAISSYERQKQEAMRQDAWSWKRQGDLYLAQQDYARAREAYQRALTTLKQLEVGDLMLQRTLESLMETDEIKHLAAGEVEFRGRWMKPEEKEEIEMTERGLVKFEDKWLPAQEVERIKQQRAQAAEEDNRAALEEMLKKEAPQKAIPVVEDFLRVAKDLAPQEAADRFFRQVIPDSPRDIPAIVIDYAVDQEPTVASDDAAVDNVSRVYCQVKAYVTISAPEGSKRLRWFFEVRRVGAEWLITSMKKED